MCPLWCSESCLTCTCGKGVRRVLNRRSVLGFGLNVGAMSLLGCDVFTGDDESTTATPPAAAPPPPTAAPPPPAAAPSAWVVSPPSFAVGSGATFNLANTLPAGIPRGGVFGVSPSGAPLPTGMTLTPVGILGVGTAKVGSVAGVVFTYASS